MENFSCVRLQGYSGSTDRLDMMQRPVVKSCVMEIKGTTQVQQATALGSAIGSSEFSLTWYGAKLLYSEFTYNLQFHDCVVSGDPSTDKNYCGGIAAIGQDESGSYRGIHAYGVSTIAADETAGDLLWLGQWRSTHGEAGHLTMSDVVFHDCNCRYGVVMTAANYACLAGPMQFGRVGCKNVIRVTSDPVADGRGTSVTIGGPIDFHNCVTAVQDNSGDAESGQALSGYTADHIYVEKVDGFSLGGPLLARMFQSSKRVLVIGDQVDDWGYNSNEWVITRNLDTVSIPHPVRFEGSQNGGTTRYSRDPSFIGRRYASR
jgi:hypothetical protein